MTDLLDRWGFYTSLRAGWWCVVLVMPSWTSEVVVHCYISVIWSCILRVLMLHMSDHMCCSCTSWMIIKIKNPIHIQVQMILKCITWWKSVDFVLCFCLCFPNAIDVYCNFFMFLVQLPTRLVICSYMFIKYVRNQKWHPRFMPTENLLPWPQLMSLAIKVASTWNLMVCTTFRFLLWTIFLYCQLLLLFELCVTSLLKFCKN
jgi:hypothetical protein